VSLAIVGLILAMGARAPLGGREDPLPAFRFVVEIDGIAATNFRSVSGLQCTTEIIEYRDGSDPNVIRLLPGLTRCGPIVLKYGLTTSHELWNWYQEVLNGNAPRKNGAVIVLDATGTERARYLFYNGWPAKWEGPTLDASTSDVAIETLELAVERIERA
jgi:phage tail-like protein